jgi:hypothetical protein
VLCNAADRCTPVTTPFEREISATVLKATYLDKIFVETVVATIPTTHRIHKTTVNDVDVGAYKTRPWLSQRWLRIQEVALSPLCQSTVCIVASQIRQTSPLQYQSAGSGKSIGLRAVVASVTENEIVGWNA